MRFYSRFILLILFTGAGFHPAAAQVTVHEDTLIIPTYPVGEPNPYPVFAALDGKMIYPYPMLDKLSPDKRDLPHRILVLENEYLRVTVLPDLGGRLYSLYDKIAGAEALYRNHVIKPGLIALRGAWTSGGIEWNFPEGHSVTTHSPVSSAIRTHADGSASIDVGAIEKVSRMSWRVTMTLHPGSATLQTDVQLYNRTALPHRYYFWANASFPANNSTRFISPAAFMTNHSGDFVYSWPVHEGVDLSWDRNHVEARSLFGVDVAEDYFGVYDMDRDAGVVHIADHLKDRGKKFWTWGNSADGDRWVDILTDHDGQYVEFQSGRFSNQSTWRPLHPRQRVQWSEWWYPVRGLGGFNYATAQAAIHVTPEGEQLKVGICATQRYPNAQLQVESNGVTQQSIPIDLDPAVPLNLRLDIPNAAESAIRLIAGDLEILYYDPLEHVSTQDMPTGPVEPAIEIPLEEMDPDAFLRRGTDRWLDGDIAGARAVITEGLNRSPKHVGLLSWSALLALDAGAYAEAESAAADALELAPWNPEALYASGLAMLYQDKTEEALNALGLLIDDPVYGNAALMLLGRLQMAAGRSSSAEQFFRQAGEQLPGIAEPLVAQAASCRKRGLTMRALQLAMDARLADPLSLPAVAEIWLCYNDLGQTTDMAPLGSRLQQEMRIDPDRLLEVAADYMAMGDDLGAFTILRHAANVGETIPADTHPVVLFYLADTASRLRMPGSVERFLRAASLAPVRHVFPYRLETLTLLYSVLRSQPEHAKASYYAGNILAGKHRLDEALLLWEQAVAADSTLAAAFRNIGRTRLLHRQDAAAAAVAYQQAIAVAPEDLSLYTELDAVYQRQGVDNATRLKNIEAGLQHGVDDALITTAAEVFNRQGLFTRTLDLLHNHRVNVWESGYRIHDLYSDAHVGAGLSVLDKRKFREALEHFQKAMEYPEHLGVGKPQQERMVIAKYYAGRTLASLGKRQEAIAMYEAALREEYPSSSPMRYFQGLAHRGMAHNGLAETWFREMIAMSEQEDVRASGLAPLLAGLGYRGLGDTRRATEAFNTFLQSSPPASLHSSAADTWRRFIPWAERLKTE